jgi:hypothetical protein
VAVIVNGTDTVAVNDSSIYPMDSPQNRLRLYQ